MISICMLLSDNTDVYIDNKRYVPFKYLFAKIR